MRLNYSKGLLSALMLVLFAGFALAQSVLTGTVVDGDKFPISGAEVTVVGTDNVSMTNDEGTFSVSVEAGEGVLQISDAFTGSQEISYVVGEGETKDLGKLSLAGDGVSLSDIVVVGKGVIDLEEDRQTPVAVSTIFKEEIQEKAQGNVEFPEVLKNTPNVYVSNQTGFGDSKMFVRGFGQTNTAFLLNGQPINGMEDGKMYWSNWSGMTEIANAVQIQRGLGSSKLAISSVGGTINIVTKATEKKQGGYVTGVVGNDSYFKGGMGYNTGLMDNGWGFSIALSHWQAQRKWAEGTKGQGQNYFLSLGKQMGDHNFNFLITGAPQWHGNRWSQSLDRIEQNPKYNQHVGFDDGEWKSERTNFYHKPIINLNWDWNISAKSNLSTVVYASFGRGGGTGDRGNGRKRTQNGYMDYDAIIAQNSAIAGGALPGRDGIWGTADDEVAQYGNNKQVWFGPDGLQGTQPGPDGIMGTADDVNDDKYISGSVSAGDDGVLGTDDDIYNDAYIRRASMNNHAWYGLVSNFSHEISDNLSFNLGADIRFYKGDHFRQVADLFGLKGWANDRPDRAVVNSEFEVNPWTALFDFASEDERIAYDNTEWINYQGLFGQIEYANDTFSAFFQGAVSNQSYERENRFARDENGNQVTKNSGKESEIGYNLKGGASFNVSSASTVYGNAGFYSRQPFLDNKFTTLLEYNEFAENEEITGFELGYRYQVRNLNFNANLYHTTWENRTIRAYDRDTDTFAVETGIGQTNMGVELDARAKISRKFNLNTYFTYGHWTLNETGGSTSYDVNNNIVGTTPAEDLDDIYTTQAPQTSFGFGLDYEIVKGLSIDGDLNWYGRLWKRDVNYNGGQVIQRYNAGTLKSYALVDAGLTYVFKFGSQDVKFRGNVYNLFDNSYIQQSDAYGYTNGNGRTWNASITYNF